MDFLSDLHAGRAGEYLVAADLLRNGFDCFHAAQGMPYDLVADVRGRLIRIQVKSTRTPEVLPGKGRLAYRFWVSRCGRGGVNRYTEDDVDVFALVALDRGSVGYLMAKDMVRTLFVAPDEHRGSHACEKKSLRNERILDSIKSGADYAAIALEHGVSTALVSKVNTGRAKTGRSVTYFSDLTFPLEKFDQLPEQK